MGDSKWTFAGGRTLTFTGEFGGEYRSAVRLGPREQWDEYPVRGNPWPEPEADYEALGYPETEAGYERRPWLLEAMLSTLHTCIESCIRCHPLSPITNNQDDIENG